MREEGYSKDKENKETKTKKGAGAPAQKPSPDTQSQKETKTMAKTYKTVDELTEDQFEELRQMMVVDVETRDGLTVPDSWYDDSGAFTDEAVKEFYEGTYFVDDDFTQEESEVAA